MFNTQRVIKTAETSEKYDPIVESLQIYIDIINIFIRIVALLDIENENKNKNETSDNTNSNKKPGDDTKKAGNI